MRGQVTILLLLALLAAARVGKFRPQRPEAQATGLQLPSHYSFTAKTNTEKANDVHTHASFDGELFYTITIQSEVIFFVSNQTEYSHNGKRCDVSKVTEEQSQLFSIGKYLNEHNKPLNKPCQEADEDGQLYSAEVPIGFGIKAAVVLCVSLDGKKPLYFDAKIHELNVSTHSVIIDFVDHADESLANFHLPQACARHNIPAGVSLKLPAQYHYRYESKNVSPNVTYSTSGTVNDNGEESVVAEHGQYSDSSYFFFRSNHTQYSSYPSVCSGSKIPTLEYNYEDQVGQFAAKSSISTVQFAGEECKHNGQDGYIWERFTAYRLCVNKAGDTPLFFEVVYSADNHIRTNIYEFKPKAAEDAPWQMPQTCLDAKVGGQ